MKKILFFMTMAVLAACSGQGNKVPAIHLSKFDTSVDQGADFYQWATGGWQEKHPLNPEYARYGSFDVLRENNEIRLNELFAAMSEQTHEYGSVNQKISDLYAMGLDSLRLNEEGAAPLPPYIDEIMGATDGVSLAKVLASVHRNGNRPFYSVSVMSDMMDSDNNVEYLNQGGLGMSDRDYYLDPANAALKEGYENFLAKVLGYAGIADAEKVAADVVAFETEIAKISWSRVEMRDDKKAYNPMSYNDILKKYPNLHLDAYSQARGIAPQEKIIVSQPSYFEKLSVLVGKTPIKTLRNYVIATVVRGACGSLSDNFTDAQFDFFSKQMAGIEVQKPRWKRSMAVPNSLLSEAVGQMYVEKYFSEKDKERMSELVKNVQDALAQHIDSLDWMSDATKARAHEKLENFVVKIGYPDEWKDYSELVIDPSISYYENLIKARNWFADDNISKLGQPVDKKEWHMSPQTVNAYYNPTSNEICFPAAILQPPFYNSDADDPVNYGAIGVVISHEMTHGFDDQGRNFDKDGNMIDWWAPEDAEAFKERADKLVAQFDEIEILPGVHANGALCLGENIADHGGLRVAYTAMENALKVSPQGKIDGFTPAQRFYIAYAALWGQNITDEEKARLTKVDVHSLGRNRVNVSIRNLDTFFEAFDIKEGDPMFRPIEERVTIW